MTSERRAAMMPRREFFGRLARHAALSVLLVCGTLFVGMAGYHWLEGLPWLDAYLNAAMILGGMGPVAELHTSAGKFFAGSYALFAGMVFLVVVAIAFAPVIHRALKLFHLADDGE